MIITVAGASGFIGRNLIEQLSVANEVRGLSRSTKEASNGVSWIKTDLFSFQSIREALQGSDVAIYLVHSMLPSSKLFQGSFQDTDLLLADNFAKACLANNIKQIIYLGGLVPTKGVSKHLESRKEVEEVFKGTGIPLTILRAGMVVGEGGSSFEILRNLVLNLPVMLLPKWTKSNTQTIYIKDLVSIISKSAGNTDFYNCTIDVVNGEKISYKELIKQSARYFNSTKILIPVPINYTSLSKLWVKIFGEADYELVSPLIDSLLCDLPNPKVSEKIADCVHYRSYRSMLKNIPPKSTKRKKKKSVYEVNNVRSIQRLPNLLKLSEEQISDEYITWLPKHLRFLVKAERQGDILEFFLIGVPSPLLTLRKEIGTSLLERVKFQIIGGLLSKGSGSGWLEFRIVANGKYTLASINEFVPSLPWYIYKITQAPAHAAVMNSFGKYLLRKTKAS